MYLPLETRITPLARVRRERLLPAFGKVLVAAGQVVDAADVIAECQLRGRTHIMEVSRILGVPSEQTSECLLKEVGATVQAGEQLALSRGLTRVFRRGCTAPASGRITGVWNGLVAIEAAPTPFELRARFPGQVVEVQPGWGAAISTVGALIQGAWGSGGEAAGVLKVLSEERDQPLRAAQIGADCSGSLVVAGRIVAGEGLEEAGLAGVSGMIVGGIDAALRQRLYSLPYPILVVEGFGVPALSDRAFTLLQSNAGREALLSTDNPAPHRTGRPEVAIPMSQEGDALFDTPGAIPLQAGMKVRGLRAPYQGASGWVRALPLQHQVVESGLRLPVAEVELLADGQLAQIPEANLEWVH